MSDPRLDALKEAAHNRGLRLVRSRVRTPGKVGFGTAGLTNFAGKPVFGIDQAGPSATPDEIENYLRGLEEKDWGASLKASGRRQSVTRRSGARAAPEPASPAPMAGSPRRVPPKPLPEPRPAPKPEVRAAAIADAARLAELIVELGHAIEPKQVRQNIAALIKMGEAPLVATLDAEIVGLCAIAKRIVISRPAPLGRITSLIVTKKAQGHGIGRMLVEAAEAWMRKEGCALVEVTSNDRRAEAHAFYRHLGYERTSIRFAKEL